MVLARGRARALAGRHPWVFSGSVDRVEGAVEDGAPVILVDASEAFIAYGLWNGRSQIRVRLYSWRDDIPLDDGFWADRVERAVEVRRRAGLLEPEGACRVIFSEGDGLSGLVVDRYGRHLALQFTSLALWAHRDLLLDTLHSALDGDPGVLGMVLRTEKGILEEEGLDISDGPLRGAIPDQPVAILENGIRYSVDLGTGQKTGTYLDQRENRARAALWAPGRRVADVCCYTGGFTLPILAAGARSVVGVDVSASALELAERNARTNGFSEALDGGGLGFVKGDAFRWLEGERDAGRRYDMIVLDPPRFARSSRGVAQALRGYGGLNELAVACLEPGGILVTCSCTGRVSRERFLQVLASVEERTGRRIRVLESRGQPADHPVSPTCPETEYLKCLICTVE